MVASRIHSAANVCSRRHKPLRALRTADRFCNALSALNSPALEGQPVQQHVHKPCSWKHWPTGVHAQTPVGAPVRHIVDGVTADLIGVAWDSTEAAALVGASTSQTIERAVNIPASSIKVCALIMHLIHVRTPRSSIASSHHVATYVLLQRPGALEICICSYSLLIMNMWCS